MNLVLTQFTLNNTGVPLMPKVVLVDRHRRDGFTLLHEPLEPQPSAPSRRKQYAKAEGQQSAKMRSNLPRL